MTKKIIQTRAAYTVLKGQTPIRFNTYCEQYVTLIPSRKGIKKAIKRGELQLNGEAMDGGIWLKEGDIITYVDLENTPPKPYHLKLEIIFEDDDLAVVIKPAGISVSGNQFKTVQNALLHNLKASEKPDKLPWPLPVHRLDNQTSGLLLVAKTKAARVKLGQAFEKKTVSKTYLALVIGKAPESGEIKTEVDGKPASSSYVKLSEVPSLKNGTLSLLALSPKTGRTHQLRIHTASIGHPILGDKLYGYEGLILKSKGLFLAAVKLEFNHPVSEKRLAFAISTPSKFQTRMANEKRRYMRFHDQLKTSVNKSK